ncbi:hypothetical protein SUGI_0031580 [Cryptomeria japonica]|nr:hypothetical protein SUGI_0031580 [Cryptomeria japonica]
MAEALRVYPGKKDVEKAAWRSPPPSAPLVPKSNPGAENFDPSANSGQAAAILYSVFQPRIPKYSVDKFQITSFALGPDATVSSQFGMVVRARNPNEKIGIDYLENSYLGVFYIGTELCRGKLPAFYQGHGSTDNLNVNLTGNQVHITSEMVSSLTAQRQQGNIPLRLKADVPVKIEFGKLKTMKITFRLRCDLVVDRLDDNTSVDISRKKCKVKL